MQNLLLKRIGKNWEDMPVEGTSFQDLDDNTIKSFIEKAIKNDRISPEATIEKREILLKNLRLVADNGLLTNAALLLFGKNPGQVTVTSSFKIGKFGKSSDDLLFQDIVETNIFEIPDKVIEILKSKYLIRPISYSGLERKEPLEYP